MEVKNKKISVIGSVRSGVAAAKLIKKLGGIPFVSDLNENKKTIEASEILNENEIEFELGSHSEKVFDCDLMVVSPGVPSDSVVIKKAKECKIKTISEIELAAGFCKGSIIAITGTNGKTTTTSLCGHVFNECGYKTYVAGNIGLAFSEIVLDVKENEFVSLEVSSFQLDLIEKFKPKVAMILNITPDHLNRYDNKIDNYVASKMKIYENQDMNDNLILNYDDKTIMTNLKNFESKQFLFSLNAHQDNGCSLSDNEILFNENGSQKFKCQTDVLSLRGEHNIANAMAVITAAKIFNFDNDKLLNALSTFKGVEHRIEMVREIDGVKYINDSKATNVDSVWYALKSFDSDIFLILGGQDKGNDYNKIKDLVEQKVKKIFAIGSSADKIFNFFHSIIKVEVKGTLEECVIAANNEARDSDVVLLSPACASFDMFDDYEHRGRVFKEAVNKL